jgi:stage II sporulation protein D
MAAYGRKIVKTLKQKKFTWLWLAVFIVVIVFFPFRTWSVPNSSSTPDFLIRALLASRQSSYEINSSFDRWQISSSASLPEIKLISSQLSLKLFPTNTTHTYFTKTSQHWNFEQALNEAERICESLKKSGLQVFVIPASQGQYSLITGPFDHHGDASFFCTLASMSGNTFEVTSMQPNHSFITIQWENNPYHLASTFFNTQQHAYRILSISNEKSISFKSRTYHHQLVISFNPDRQLMIINELPLEEYLRAVVPAEMPHRWHLEALKAQAVASRSFALSRALQARRNNAPFDVTDDTYTQVFPGARYFSESDSAVLSTRHQIMSFNNQVVECVFHSTSGGHTEHNELVWSGGARTYLRGVLSDGEEISPHFTWYKLFSEEEFLKKINHYQISKNRSETLDMVDDASIIEQGASPRVRKIILYNKKQLINLTGQEMQTIFSLKSTWFDVLVWKPAENSSWWKDFMNPSSKAPAQVYIFGRGWGHGVGMSQYGAAAMANRGANYQEILRHFYQGAGMDSLSSFSESGLNSLNFVDQTHQLCTLSFNPDPIIAEPGQLWEVELNISSPSSIQGFSMDLSYDPSMVSIHENDILEGSFLQTGGKTTLFMKNQQGSTIHIGLGREGQAGGVTGKGTLLKIKGKSLKEGISQLHIENLHVFDSQLQQIPSEWSGGSIQIIEIDRTPPSTLIVEYPPGYVNYPFVSFKWTGSDNKSKTENLLYSYQLNEEAWSVFSQKASYTFHLVQDGVYHFKVRARDEAGNIDPNPPMVSFFLDTTPPLIEIDSHPSSTSLAFIILRGKTEADATLLINAERAHLASDGSFEHRLPLDPGENNIRLIAIDPASNTTSRDIVIVRHAVKTTHISLTIGSQRAIVNQSVKTLDASPFIYQSRSFVPLRFIAESFLATVEWDATDKQIAIRLDHPLLQRSLILWVGSLQAMKDGHPMMMDVAPMVLPPGRTFVPIRFIAENFDSKVEWFPQTQNISILFPDPELYDMNLKLQKVGDSS